MEIAQFAEVGVEILFTLLRECLMDMEFPACRQTTA